MKKRKKKKKKNKEARKRKNMAPEAPEAPGNADSQSSDGPRMPTASEIGIPKVEAGKASKQTYPLSLHNSELRIRIFSVQNPDSKICHAQFMPQRHVSF